ncbi:MAG TPA: hypothetical protein VNN07_03710 [Candidatus Tectomicrobia bacterium]|nr:hypothetical protein [Candidatus Tectomicrobia bacterium]
MFAWLSLTTVLLGVALHLSGTNVGDTPVAWPVLPAVVVCWVAMVQRVLRIRRRIPGPWFQRLLQAAPLGVRGFVVLFAFVFVGALVRHDGTMAATERVGRAALALAASIPMVFFAFIEPRQPRPPKATHVARSSDGLAEAGTRRADAGERRGDAGERRGDADARVH